MLATGLAVTWSLAACAPAAITPTPTPTLLVLKVGLVLATANAPIIVPAEEGQFAGHGLKFDLEPVTDPTQAIISAATGQFDITYAGMTAATLNALNRGVVLADGFRRMT
jgi:ABC-type nitrate/sulfonate/bicarbonate transport system substrate-binding protein